MSGQVVIESALSKQLRVARPDLLLGTRGSALALWQANAVRGWLLARDGNRQIELSVITSDGDRDKQSPLMTIGGRGVFTSALQEALLAGEIDLAVHCTKDLPGITPYGLEIAAFPERETSLDALISRHNVGLQLLPPSPIIGTSSRRRAVQILALRQDARIVDLRGNIDTRIRKSRTDSYDAIVLAAAGLARMGWECEITELLPIETFTPAPGQGALAVETRSAPDAGWAHVRELDNADVRLTVMVERAFLQGVGGGCTTPIGAHAAIVGQRGRKRIEFHAMLSNDEGTRLERIREEFSPETATDEVFALAQRMLHSVQPSWAGVSFATVEHGGKSPVHGARVLVTGTPNVVDAQMAMLHTFGADPFFFPTVLIEPVTDATELDKAMADVAAGTYDWVVFTSANAVSAITNHVAAGLRINARVAAVGVRTMDALSDIGIQVSLVPERMSATGLLAAMASESLAGKRVLLPTSSLARLALADGLRTMGAVVGVVTAYHNVAVTAVAEGTIASLKEHQTNAVMLSSPSAVASLVDLLGADIATISGAFFIAIGEPTAAAMAAAHLPVHGVASEPTVHGMIDALLGCYGIEQDVPGLSEPSVLTTGGGQPA